MTVAASRKAVGATANRGPSEPMMWLFILGDMSIFALFFGAYLWAFGGDRQAFAADAESLLLPLGLLNTIILLTSSYIVVRAVQTHRAGESDAARRYLGWALCTAAAFVAVKVSEYAYGLLRGHGLTTSDFFMYYFVLTGLHLMHVTIGCALLQAWRRSLRAKAGPYSATSAESIAGYWHMVDLLWVIIFSLLYIGAHA